MSDTQLINKMNETPDLWIERLVIYGDYAKNEVIRDQSFSRGLNVIWGVSQTPQDAVDSEGSQLVGHSVGKTSLCRLIRYALDEDTFGQAEASDMIRQRFPEGAVGVTVHLKGTPWSVVRRFAGKDAARAAQGVDIEALLDTEPKDCNYSVYSRTLRQAFADGLPGYENADDKRCTWHDLLAWMTRDQEARYQELWHWRDHRSNAEKQQMGKDSALKLMRSVLGLYSTAEESLLREKESLTKERDASKKARDQAESSRDARNAFVDEALKGILDAHSAQSDPGSLFGIDSTSDVWLTECGQRLEDLRKERERIQWELAGCRADEQAIQSRVATVHRHLVTLRDGIETNTEDALLRKLEENRGKDCVYGDIAFSGCEHYLEHLRKLKNPFAVFSRQKQAEYSGSESGEQEQAEHSWVTEQLLQSTRLGELRKASSELEARDRELESEIVRLSSDMFRLRSYKADKVTYNSELADTISTLNKRLDDLQTAIKGVENSLGSERVKHKALCDELEGLFNRLIQHFLSPQYLGRIVFFPVEKLDFRINGMKGEAVQTFTCIMADIAAMLWSVEGKGYHPRFLIHDSPREADLSGTAYASFLSWMHRLSESLGGDNAPFQYFVTTTTSPPQELIDAGSVRLKLSSIPPSDMLYKDNIELALALTQASEKSGERGHSDDVTEG